MKNFVDSLFSDLSTNLGAHPLNKDLTIAKDVVAVNTSLRNLILTKAYERFFHPEIGGDVSHYLFENPSPLTEFAIKDRVERVVNQFEGKRVNLLNTAVTLNPDDNNYIITLKYMLVNRLEPVVLSVILKRVR